MSFSGLKTSARYFLESENGKTANRADVAASFQAAIVDVLIDRLDRAYARTPEAVEVVLSGGVAANSALQHAFRAWAARNGVEAVVPAPRFCTDNAAMICAAADAQGEAVRADVGGLAAHPNLAFAFEPRAGLRR
jgi:N6-L-threonylcarbamoyladenine synthase